MKMQINKNEMSDTNKLDLNHLSRYSTEQLQESLRNLQTVKNNKSILCKLKDGGESVFNQIVILEGEIAYRTEVDGMNKLFDRLELSNTSVDALSNKHVQYVLSKEVLNNNDHKFKTNSTKLDSSSHKLNNEKPKAQMLQMQKSLNLQTDRFKKLKFVED